MWDKWKNSFVRLVYAGNFIFRLPHDGILFSDNVYNTMLIFVYTTYCPLNVKRKESQFDWLVVSSPSFVISKQSSFWLYTFLARKLMYHLSLWLSVFRSCYCFNLWSKALFSHRMLRKLDQKWLKLVSLVQKTYLIIWSQRRWSWECSWFLSRLILFLHILLYNLVHFQLIICAFKWE